MENILNKIRLIFFITLSFGCGNAITIGTTIVASTTISCAQLSESNGGIKPTLVPLFGVVDTTPDGYQLFISCGDSKAAGKSDATGSSNAGVAKEWDRTLWDFTTVGTGSDVKYVATTGSQWPSFFNNYNSLTGYKVAFVNSGSGGSLFHDVGNTGSSTNNWTDANGTLYAAMVARVNAALSNLKLNTVKGFFITLGVNDFVQSNGVSDLTPSVTALIDRINKDFNNPNIYLNVVGCSQTQMNTTKGNDYKQVMKTAATTYSNVYYTVNEQAIFNNGYTTDGTHWNSTGNDIVGRMLAEYVSSTETDKDIRQLTTCNNVTSLSSGQKAAIKTFVQRRQSASNWPLTSLQIYKSSSGLNKFFDLNGMLAPIQNSADFSNAGYAETGGTSTTYIGTSLCPSSTNAKHTQDDIIIAVETATVTTGAGVTACLFGCSSGTGRDFLRQLNTNRLGWEINDGTETTYLTDASFANNTIYGMYRNNSSTTKSLLKGTTTVQTASVTSTGISTGTVTLGKRDGATDFLQSQFTYFFCGKYTKFSADTNFTADLNTLMNAL